MADHRRRPRERNRHYSWTRRSIQGAALVVFLVLLLWVCWPYSAQPARIWAGWMPVGVDAQTGRVTVAAAETPSDAPSTGQVIYVVDDGPKEGSDLGRFQILQAETRELVLAPHEPLTPDQLLRLEASVGPWSLHEGKPGGWPAHFADDLAVKEKLPAETFLLLDPLAGISAAMASSLWPRAVFWSAAILLICLVVPRGFCGYLCPLGTTIDLFDRVVSRRLPRLGVPARGWLRKLRFVVLATVLGAAAMGVLLAGFVSAIPVLTRGLVASLSPLQSGLLRGWHQVPPLAAADLLSIGLLAAVLGLGLLRPRFWCRYVCPTGAVFSIGTLVAVFRRKVNHRCRGCGLCAQACPFGAMDSGQYDARVTDCTFCRTCASVCPADAVQFVGRWGRSGPESPGTAVRSPSRHEAGAGSTRRSLLSTAASGAIAALGGCVAAVGTKALGARIVSTPLVRPPGSVPEKEFLQLCIRCGACLRACPNNAIRPVGFERGVEGLWTPHVVANWSGCETSCNRCGQVCPTGAIRPLPLEEKRAARIGRAAVNQRTCLPHSGQGDCQLCINECASAGYRAIEIVRVGTQLDSIGQPIEDSGYLAPVVIPDRCVGCGLCQSRCHAVNVVQKGALDQAAIVVESGKGKEDRLLAGSYMELRMAEQRDRVGQRRKGTTPKQGQADYLPEF